MYVNLWRCHFNFVGFKFEYVSKSELKEEAERIFKIDIWKPAIFTLTPILKLIFDSYVLL